MSLELIQPQKEELIRVDRVPIPFGKHQSQDKIVNGIITMAQLVDNFYTSRNMEPPNDELTQGLQRVTTVMNKEDLSVEQKRQAVTQMLEF